MKKIIVGIGEILWDVFPNRKILGGAPANFAYHASQFGFEGYAVSAIGKDSPGDEILANLAEKSLNYIIERTDYPTGTVQVTLNSAGVPQYEICEGVAWDYIPMNSKMEKLAKETKAVTFGSLAQRNAVSRETINRFLDLLPEDAFRIFDINLRQHYYTKELIEQYLLKCNILKINEEEVAAVCALFGWTDLSESAFCQKILSDYRLRLVILTRGTEGSFVFTPYETSFQETPKVEVADTVGAGDSFTGAFVAALLHGLSIREAHLLAVKVSAYVCTQHGAMPKLPVAFFENMKK